MGDQKSKHETCGVLADSKVQTMKYICHNAGDLDGREQGAGPSKDDTLDISEEQEVRGVLPNLREVHRAIVGAISNF